MKMIAAIVRASSIDAIVKSFNDTGIRGMTIFEVKGIGEQVELFTHYTVHKMIQIITPDEKVDEITNIILEHAHSGLAGDGIIIVHPLDYMIKVRTKEKLGTR
jgi:nitrogen regulatory protein PII